jgi:AraC-like DNA-binding protein
MPPSSSRSQFAPPSPQRPAEAVTRGYALAVFDYLEKAGHDPVNVFDPARVHAIRQDPLGERLSIAQWEHMLLRASRHLNDPAFVLKLAPTIKPRHLGMLGFLLMSCETLGAAALTLQRYEQLLDGINEAEFHVEGDVCTLTWRPLIERPPVEFTMLSMALWAHHARWLAERDDLVCGANFAFGRPASDEVVDLLRSTFGGPIQFDAPHSQMLVPVAYLSLPVAHGDKHVHASLRQQAETDLVRLLGSDHGFMAHLQALVAERLAQGQATLEHVAGSMGLAPRTLQSRLDQHGVTYREVLDHVRCRQAERYLGDPAKSLADVAALLGFSDQSGFQHAFKRWTGTSPGEWRRRLA